MSDLREGLQFAIKSHLTRKEMEAFLFLDLKPLTAQELGKKLGLRHARTAALLQSMVLKRVVSISRERIGEGKIVNLYRVVKKE